MPNECRDLFIERLRCIFNLHESSCRSLEDHLVNDLTDHLQPENCNTILLTESPHKSEVYRRYPLAGQAGAIVAGAFVGTMGEILDCERFDDTPLKIFRRMGVMNVSRLPLQRKAYKNVVGTLCEIDRNLKALLCNLKKMRKNFGSSKQTPYFHARNLRVVVVERVVHVRHRPRAAPSVHRRVGGFGRRSRVLQGRRRLRRQPHREHVPVATLVGRNRGLRHPKRRCIVVRVRPRPGTEHVVDAIKDAIKDDLKRRIEALRRRCPDVCYVACGSVARNFLTTTCPDIQADYVPHPSRPDAWFGGGTQQEKVREIVDRFRCADTSPPD